MKEIVYGYGLRAVCSDRALLCKWLDVEIVDDAGTIFEGEEWVSKFANADSEEEARLIFNQRHEGEWKFNTCCAVKELKPHSWEKRRSMADLFSQYIPVIIFVYPDRFRRGRLKRTAKGFYIQYHEASPTPIDSDAEYGYVVLDRGGNVVKPYAGNGPWSAIISELKTLGYA